MKKSFDIIVVIPIGPGTDVGFVTDTIGSFVHFARHSYRIVLADDSHAGIGPAVKEIYPQADVLCTIRPMGGWAGLYLSLASAYRHAIENYQFRLLLKLDTDALIIGPGIEQDAFDFFNAHHNMGIAGQYPLDYEGNQWDSGWPRDRVLNGATNWKAIRRPIANILLRKLYIRAKANGYKAGESVFGGAYFMSHQMLNACYYAGLLPNFTLGKLNLGEDHLFSLLAKAMGFDLGNMASGDQPFACAWKGLPAAPEQLFNEGKKIIHSTRFWQNMNEAQIRNYYQVKRN